MTYSEFKLSLKQNSPPDVNIYLRSLWFDSKGQWAEAHDLIDPVPGNEAARIHAYLHRKEGDNWNANYWYSKANMINPNTSLEDEWATLVRLHL